VPRRGRSASRVPRGRAARSARASRPTRAARPSRGKPAARPARTLPGPRALAQRHIQAINKRNLDALVELFAPDAVVEFTAGPTLEGRGAIRRAYARYFREWDAGQHRVPRLNIPGRIVLPLRAYEHTFTAVWEVARGRIRRHRVDYDVRNLVRQMVGP
jgi:hypothetical protein